MTPPAVDGDRGRRHAIAAVILAAFRGDAALDELRRRVVAAARADPSVRRLRAGLAAAIAYRDTDDVEATPLVSAMRETVCLWREGLFFEAHERLEGEWRALAGRRRSALQGVIQLAVALHHLAHGNARGAASLVAKGREHLERDGAALAEVDVSATLAAFTRWERVFRVGRWPPRLAPPALVLRVSSARARRPSG